MSSAPVAKSGWPSDAEAGDAMGGDAGSIGVSGFGSGLGSGGWTGTGSGGQTSSFFPNIRRSNQPGLLSSLIPTCSLDPA